MNTHVTEIAFTEAPAGFVELVTFHKAESGWSTSLQSTRAGGLLCCGDIVAVLRMPCWYGTYSAQIACQRLGQFVQTRLSFLAA